MKLFNLKIKNCWFALALTTATLASCDKNDNPNNLPEVNPSDYQGKVDGFTSSDEVYPEKLVAYWSFDASTNEAKSNTAVTTASNATLVDGGVKGKAVNFTSGFLYYGTQFNALKTDALKDFTVSTWVQLSNNGSKKTMLFQIARPGMFNGNLDFGIETNIAANLDDIKIHPYFTTLGNGRQDNVNANYTLTPKIGVNKWVHIALAYTSTTGTFKIFANGVDVGSYSNRGVGNNVFNSWEPNEVIIGGNYNVIPGKSVSADVSYAAMTGKMDELRIYNIAIPDAIIGSLYKLGLAGK